MPKLLNSLPKYRRHKASSQAIVTLDGKDFYLGPYNSQTSKTEYDRLIAEWLANGRRLSTTDGVSINFEELLAAFWKHAQAYYVGLDGKPTKELDSYRKVAKYGSASLQELDEQRLAHIETALKPVRTAKQ